MSGVPSRAGFDEETRRTIAHWIARGYSREAAAQRAKVPESPRLSAYYRTKTFAADLREAIGHQLATQLAPKAISRLESILDDTEASSKVVLDAVKVALDRGGHPTPVGRVQDVAEKPMVEMTEEELVELIARLEREKAEQARLVNPATDSPTYPQASASELKFLD